MDFLRRLQINLEWLLLRAVTLCDSTEPGWVVLCEHVEQGDDYHPDWHAMAGGDTFGMDHNTGRFDSRQDAYQFAQHRNAIALRGERYYVTHQSTHPELPETY